MNVVLGRAVFKQRIKTAVVLLVLCLFLLFWAPIWVLQGVVDFIVLLAAWEWSSLARFEKKMHRIFFIFGFSMILFCVSNFPARLMAEFSVVWWFFALFLVMQYRGGLSEGRASVLPCLFGFWVLVPFDVSFKTLLMWENARNLVLFILLMVWAVDSCAYFCGKQWGKHTLLPYVSPAKTVEGLIGGFLGALIVGWLWSIVEKQPFGFREYFLILGVASAAVVGDLFESMMKRQRGIKDSGSFLPGHGGILDRIDSLTAAVPVFLFFYHG